MNTIGEKEGTLNLAERASEILIVDDDLDFINDLLAAWIPPAPVAIVNSGREAVEYLGRRMPSLVLLDLVLPHFLAPRDDMEGLAIFGYLRERFGGHCPVIVISKESSPEMRQRVAALEAAEFIGKPVSVKALEDVISRTIQMLGSRGGGL